MLLTMCMLYAEQSCVGWTHKGPLTELAGGEKVTSWSKKSNSWAEVGVEEGVWGQITSAQ